MVDEYGAATDDGITYSQYSQVSLSLGRPMVDWGEQLRIEASQASEDLGIGAISLAGIVVDRS
jgi:hypothetical protein